ncbi:MAG TPA: hypothetical protein VHO90_08245 [Bacteroidales bacterium]|nr:hypothetical protein [Bacteroidales bacterium]
MEGKDNVLESLIESAEEFGKTSIELLKYKALDKATFAASSIVLNVTVFLIAILFVIMFSIGLSWWIGEALHKIYLGFFIVSAFYAICALSFYFFFGQNIKKLVSGIILKQIFKEN